MEGYIPEIVQDENYENYHLKLNNERYLHNFRGYHLQISSTINGVGSINSTVAGLNDIEFLLRKTRQDIQFFKYIYLISLKYILLNYYETQEEYNKYINIFNTFAEKSFQDFYIQDLNLKLEDLDNLIKEEKLVDLRKEVKIGNKILTIKQNTKLIGILIIQDSFNMKIIYNKNNEDTCLYLNIPEPTEEYKKYLLEIENLLIQNVQYLLNLIGIKFSTFDTKFNKTFEPLKVKCNAKELKTFHNLIF